MVDPQTEDLTLTSGFESEPRLSPCSPPMERAPEYTLHAPPGIHDMEDMDSLAAHNDREDSTPIQSHNPEHLAFTSPSIAHVDIPPILGNGGPLLRRKKDGGSFLNIIPPSIITSRLTNDRLPAGKHVWIMSPQRGNTVVGQGKSGVGWKSKSKLGTLCSPGQQWVHVYRTFAAQVPFMYPPHEGSSGILEDALPPACGKHKPIKWECKFMVSYALTKP